MQLAGGGGAAAERRRSGGGPDRKSGYFYFNTVLIPLSISTWGLSICTYGA